ncbi:ATP-binding cassette domain-containing protein [Anatilimnocola floriformis]|uniref:ATP-binding cassette domain-containing protein n=1 Tax=Anatilimnocola floriformis TaxID=2948575 RepID=UPI0020C1BEBA|nr:ATP-binding cassette domain-containing protein [Anatilimnocola floriformis]
MSVLQFNCRFRYPTGFKLDQSFAVERGITALVGPSGAGKTTILHLIAGLLRPQAGQIVLADKTLFDSARGVNVPPYRRSIGMVFQDYLLFPHMTVDKNLRYGASRGTAATASLSPLIDALELGDLLQRFPASLSGGQRQRVALGRAIASNPSILLLDEPISALDPELKKSVISYLAQTLKKYPVPTILVTHDLTSVEAVCTGVVRLPGN